MFDCSLRSRGSRFEAAAFLTHSQTKGVSARSFVQDSGARSWARWNLPSSSLRWRRRRPSALSRWADQNDTNLLPGNHLGGPIDVSIDEDCGDWVSARHRMIGKKDHRLAARRNLDRAANDALAGQLLLSDERYNWVGSGCPRSTW